jgi:hypothetical protein
MLKTDLGLGQKQILLYSAQTTTSTKGQTSYLNKKLLFYPSQNIFNLISKSFLT